MLLIKNFVRYFFIGVISLPKILLSIIIHFFIGLKTFIIIFPKYFFIGIMVIFGKNKDKNKIRFKKINTSKNKIILGLTLSIYLICIFFISKWTVQQLKIKYLSETILKNTEILINEQQIVNDIEDIDEIDSDDNISNNQDNSTTVNNDDSSNEVIEQYYYPNDYWDYIDVPFINVNFNELLQKNSDTVGWIKINNTKVNYPVVQTTDNSFYLNHSFNKSKNSGGWVYADFRADFTNFDKNTIIYAHNLTNRTMFGSLVETQKSYWYTNPDNSYIKISTPTSNTVWLIFSLYTIDPTIDYLRTNFDDNNYEEFLNLMKSRSIYDFNVNLTTEDKILTLSTCNDAGTKRIVVQAKMISINYK